MPKSPDLSEKRYRPEGYPWENVPSPKLPIGYRRSRNTLTGQTIIQGRPRLPINHARRAPRILKRG